MRDGWVFVWQFLHHRQQLPGPAGTHEPGIGSEVVVAFGDPRRQFQRFAADEDLRRGDDAAVATDWTSSIPARSGEW